MTVKRKAETQARGTAKNVRATSSPVTVPQSRHNPPGQVVLVLQGGGVLVHDVRPDA